MIIILDFGSQYTLLIARRLRELGYYAEIIDGTVTSAPINKKITGIILSGGPDSVTENNSRTYAPWVLELKVPILGICYGMQLLMQKFGGKIRSSTRREYGKVQLKAVVAPSQSMGRLEKQFWDTLKDSSTVWMSHGDDCEALPNEFIQTFSTDYNNVIAAVSHKSLPIFGLQFHPEVEHTQYGKDFLDFFAKIICKTPGNWKNENILLSTTEVIRKTVQNERVLVACSGGVDSSVLAAVLVKALGVDKVEAVLCDTGLMRRGEVDWVVENLKSVGVSKVHVLRCESQFFSALKNVTDPEQKRKIIGKVFIDQFESFSAQFAQKDQVHFLAQGTLYPDVIESAGHGSGSHVIKTHHNVGGLPEKLSLKLLEPFRFLFKDEVRQLGRLIGMSSELVDRHPFPGPGLAVRIIGEVTNEGVRILALADEIFINKLKSHDLYHKVWQAFAVLLPIKTVGVMGDNRTYQHTIALRTVTSVDGMTADVGMLPIEFLTLVANEIIHNVSGVNRVVYDITSKPPATIEWE